MFKDDYYLGYDIGTDSIGMAVTDNNYNVLRHKGKAMWFVKQFDESSTAAERRVFRSATRRMARRRERIALLQMLFSKTIAEKDVAFFQRLKESNLYQEDKTVDTPYAVFDGDNYTDKDFHKEYPTIYHLRKELIENSNPHDVRLVYLALHHLIKHRGHFLFESLDTNGVSSFDSLFKELKIYLKDEYEFEINCDNPAELGNVLKDDKLTITKKYTEALKICGINKKTEKRAACVISLLCGKSDSASVLFDEEILTDEEKPLKIELKGDFDNHAEEYAKYLDDRFELIERLKGIYDWTVLADVLKGEKYISFAKVKSYDKHAKDLKTLKNYIKTYCPKKYKEILSETKKNTDNYPAYCGIAKKNGRKVVLEHRCEQDAFCKYLLKVFKDLPQDGYEEMFVELEAQSFMPKQRIKDNGVIPMQINRSELTAILDNAKGYLEFLNETDEKGKSVSDKIIDIFNYRIPYYVGPLNKGSDKAWLERKDGKIYPWNFNEIVDVDASAENFINNLTSKCTYLKDKDVIPKNSVLYSKFTVLNELNNLRVNGEKISVELKQSIYNDLFLTRKKVTLKGLTNYLKSNGYEDIDITGIDGDFKSSMKSYLDLKDYGLNEQEMDSVITAITIFGDDKKLLRKRLKKEFANKFDEKDITKISRLKYSGWGRLSHEFLCDIYDVNPETGELLNIIGALWETNDNLMILLGSKYNYYQKVKEASQIDTTTSLKEMVDSLYVSPSVKRPILQSLRMAQEIVKVMGKPPKKIFVEMTRSEGEKGKRTVSRKDSLMELYKSCKKEAGELYERLNGIDNERLRQDKLYLYFTQFGKCMYTGERIPFENLFDNNIYDIDHIYPRSKIKDDSLTNRVLVKKEVNSGKDNVYPLSGDIRRKMYPHWKFLLDKGLIKKEKFKRLTRVEALSDSELADFISRQLVETSQSTKAVAQILEQFYPKPETDIVYVKARNVSEFRHHFDMLKCREVNDLHHAKDAYLNIVVGNVYDELYTRNKANFINGLQTKKYSLNAMFRFNVKRAWVADNNESLNIVKKTMNKNNIICTRYSSCQHGSLFKLNPLKKGSGQVPLKKSGPLSDIEKYGGYDRPISTYFTLVNHTGKKGKECLSMQPINLYQLEEFEKSPTEFLENELHLENPQIMIKKVKYNTCIEIDGFRMYISSKSGKQLIYKPAMQLILGYSQEKYIRSISKYINKYSYRSINESDHITEEENVQLFDLLLDKMTSTVFKVKYKDMGEKIKAKRENYLNLSLEKQCYVILEILNMLHSNVLSADLTHLGLSKNSGIITTPINYSGIKGKVKIINQSVTGLFENEFVIK